MGKSSRTKGATFERDIARELFLLTGVTFKRNLEQTRQADHGDLVADDADWPFSCELKRYASGISCLSSWKVQASKAAALCGKIPAVIFKFDRQPIRVAVPIDVLFGTSDDCRDEWAEMTLDGFAYISREMMARKNV